MSKSLSSINKIFLGLIFISVIAACTRESTGTHGVSEKENTCINLAKFANNVMKKHQDNILMADVFKEIDAMADVSGESKTVLKEIAVEAYRQGVFTDESFRERQLVEFSNDVHIKCLDAMK
ncbi:hypothetical protein [Acinetobacter sp. P1332]|uniref:hypothetical protein n=1 Tax=Acinetobacter sp. P1332 TaxID=3366266 RepID=UPI00375760F1